MCMWIDKTKPIGVLRRLVQSLQYKQQNKLIYYKMHHNIESRLASMWYGVHFSVIILAQFEKLCHASSLASGSLWEFWDSIPICLESKQTNKYRIRLRCLKWWRCTITLRRHASLMLHTFTRPPSHPLTTVSPCIATALTWYMCLKVRRHFPVLKLHTVENKIATSLNWK